MLIQQGVRFPRRCASLPPLCVRRKPKVPVDDAHLFSGGFPWPDQRAPSLNPSVNSLMMRAMQVTLILVLMALAFPCYAGTSDSCSYNTWVWSPTYNKALGHKRIKKPKSELTPEELGSVKGCTVCEEDQVEIKLESLPAFKVCKVFEANINRAIKQALAQGFSLSTVTGYRVGKSKGPLNGNGERTQFSNHSFGTAIDFNAEKNGLYDFCTRFSPACKLLRGGDYRPGTPGSITKESSLYKAFLAQGFKWGGELEGKQKDFMHFSLTGS